MSFAAYPKYESYKDSGVQWLGNIPSHWAVRRAGFLLDELNERSKDGSEPLLSLSKTQGVIRRDSLAERGGHAESLVGYKLVCEGDIVINRMQAANGLLAVSRVSGITSPDYAIYRTKRNTIIRNDIVTALLQQPEYQGEIKRRVKGVMEGFIRLYSDDLFRLPMICAPIKEQHAIAAFLDEKCTKIDEAVQIKEEQIKLLRERRQILIQQAVTCGLNPDAPMKDSSIDWIGQIPAHWNVKRLRYATEISPSRRLDGNTNRNDQVVFLPMEAIGVDGQIQQSNIYDAKDVAEGFTYFRSGDVIMAKITPCFENGKAAFLKDLATPYGFGTTELHVLRPNTVTGDFLYYFINQGMFRDHGEIFMVGSAGQKRVSTDYMKNQSITEPPISEQIEITTYLEAEDVKTQNAISIKEAQITALKEYKTTLINSAVTGKIKVT